METRFIRLRRSSGTEATPTKKDRPIAPLPSRASARLKNQATATPQAAESKGDASEMWVEVPQVKRRKVQDGQGRKDEVQASDKSAQTRKQDSTPARSRRSSGRVTASSSKNNTKDGAEASAATRAAGRSRSRRRPEVTSGSPDSTLLGEREKAARQETQSLKRSRQEFEEEVEQTRLELGREKAAVAKKAAELKRLDSRMEKDVGAYKKKNLALRSREKECEERERALQNREQEVKDRVLVLKITRAEDAIAELEARWQCALCCDVMACPYILNPPTCGHTFCAACLLKWFFTHLCNSCGNWCSLLECPLCRALLPPVRAQLPRPMHLLPFLPARDANDRISELVIALRTESMDTGNASNSKGKGKKKRANQGTESMDTGNASSSKGKGKKERVNPGTGAASGWEEGGSLRREWEERDRRGRTEMRDFITGWPTFSIADLRATKTRICATT